MMNRSLRNKANDVNDPCPWHRVASGRGSGRAPQVVTQRKPCGSIQKLDIRSRIRIGTWNVRTLFEVGAARLLCDQLETMNISIMGLQEVRWPGAGELEVGQFNILWSGLPEDQPRQQGVGLVLARHASQALMAWHPVNSRLMVAKFRHRFGIMSVVVAYAPTNEASDEDKDLFYQDLDSAWQLINPNDLVVCLGDFNAVSGTDRSLPRVVGPHGSGVPNDNSERFVNFCAGADLMIAGSWFRRTDVRRFSWISNDNITRKEIDHILVNRRWNSITNCRVYRQLEFNSDHLAVVGTFRLKLKRLSVQRPLSKRYDIARLSDVVCQHNYAVAIQNRFSVLSNADSGWEEFKTAHQDCAESVIGLRQRTRHEWISDETRSLVDRKRSARLAGDTTGHRELTKLCRKSARLDKQNWADKKATAGEAALKMGSVRDAFSNFRQLKAACPRISSPVFDSGGTLVSDRLQKAQCWKSYYEELLNHPPSVPPDDLVQAAATAMPDDSISCHEPTEDEVAWAMKRLKSGKAPGICGITAEMLKASGAAGLQWLTKVIQAVWRSGSIPEDWRKGIILPLYKGKGSRRECKNYRGITLLSVPGKVFASVVLERVRSRLHEVRRREQSGFTPNRSTVDRIASLNVILQTRREFNRPLWVAYVDLKSAFDSVDRDALWLLLKSIGLPQKIVDLMEAMYTDTCSAVLSEGVQSDWFSVQSGVRQGCRIAPDLFLSPMDWILERTVHKSCSGTTLGGDVFTDLDFADDVALLADMLDVLLLALDTMSSEAASLGLKVNWNKTKIQQFSHSTAGINGTPLCPSTVSVGSEPVEVVDSFIYLGTLVSCSGSSEEEIKRRIAIARNCMYLLEKNIWRSSITLDTKIRLYRVYILPVLLYGCETWSVTKRMEARLDAFDVWCLRKILRIPYTRHVTNREVRTTTGCDAVSLDVQRRRLQFFGHVVRSSPSEDHHRALAAAVKKPPADWKRPPGRPQTTWLRMLERDLKPLSIGLATAWRKAANRDQWREVINTATLSRVRH